MGFDPFFSPLHISPHNSRHLPMLKAGIQTTQKAHLKTLQIVLFFDCSFYFIYIWLERMVYFVGPNPINLRVW